MEDQDFISPFKEQKVAKEQIREPERKFLPMWDSFIRPHEDAFSVVPLTQTLSSSRDLIFVCYSYEDTKTWERFRRIFTPAIKRRKLSLWAEALMVPGAIRTEEIQKALARAKVAILLASADFLESDSITTRELPSLLGTAKEKGLTLLWIAVGYCLYEETEIAHYQSANDPKKPLVELRTYQQDKIFVNVCKWVIWFMEQ